MTKRIGQVLKVTGQVIGFTVKAFLLLIVIGGTFGAIIAEAAHTFSGH